MKKILFLDYNPPWQSTKGFFITKEKSPIWYEATKQNFFLKNIRQYKKVSFSRFPCVPCGSISKSAESYSHLSVVSVSNRVVSTRYFLLFDSLDFIGAIHSCNFANSYFLDWCLSCLHTCSKSAAKIPTQTKIKKSKIHLVSFMVTILIFCPSTYFPWCDTFITRKTKKKKTIILHHWPVRKHLSKLNITGRISSFVQFLLSLFLIGIFPLDQNHKTFFVIRQK